MEKNIQKIKNKKPIGIMGILCGHWNCGRSFGLGIAEDHGNRNRMIWEWIPEKSIFRIIRCSCVLWAEHYRDISKVIRGLSGRYGNGHGKR